MTLSKRVDLELIPHCWPYNPIKNVYLKGNLWFRPKSTRQKCFSTWIKSTLTRPPIQTKLILALNLPLNNEHLWTTNSSYLTWAKMNEKLFFNYHFCQILSIFLLSIKMFVWHLKVNFLSKLSRICTIIFQPSIQFRFILNMCIKYKIKIF